LESIHPIFKRRGKKSFGYRGFGVFSVGEVLGMWFSASVRPRMKPLGFFNCWMRPQLTIVDISFRNLVGLHQHQLVSRTCADLSIGVGITKFSNLSFTFNCSIWKASINIATVILHAINSATIQHAGIIDHLYWHVSIFHLIKLKPSLLLFIVLALSCSISGIFIIPNLLLC